MYDLDSVAYECWYDTAYGPCPRNRADEEKYYDGGGDVSDIVPYGLFKIAPWDFEKPHGQEDADSCGEQEGHLAGTQDGIASENADVDGQKGYKDCEGKEGKTCFE